VTVICPGISCRERQLRDFSYTAGLPVINEKCPACVEAPKERHTSCLQTLAVKAHLGAISFISFISFCTRAVFGAQRWAPPPRRSCCVVLPYVS
jgi:hypothetical protein